MSRAQEFVRGSSSMFLMGFHEERTEVDPPDDQEPTIVKDSNDTPSNWL